MEDKLKSRVKKYISRKEQEVVTLRKRNERLIEKAEEYVGRYRGSSSDFQNHIELLRDMNPDIDAALFSREFTGIAITDKLLLIDRHAEALFLDGKISEQDYRNMQAYTRTFRDFIRARYLSKELYEFIIKISLGDFLKEVDNGTLCDRVHFWECGMSYEEETIRKKRPWNDIAEELHFRQRRFNSAARHYNQNYIESFTTAT